MGRRDPIASKHWNVDQARQAHSLVVATTWQVLNEVAFLIDVPQMRGAERRASNPFAAAGARTLVTVTAEGHRATGCLFCGNASARFLSEEHIIPLAAGNNVDSGLVDAELVIAPGVVCDKCNGKRLSQRDNALVSWPPISIFRTLGQVVNRRGALVDAVQGTQWRVKINASDPRKFTLSADADTGVDVVRRAPRPRGQPTTATTRRRSVLAEARSFSSPTGFFSRRWGS